MNDEPLAPIAVFAFKRPTDTRRLLQSLCANPEWIRSDVWVFCEGPRGPGDQAAVDATRAVVREQAWHPKMRVIEHESNQGCAKSIIDGIGRVLTQHETIIVLEDDLEVSPTFLSYMNRALVRYAGEPRVMQVAGYAFPVAVQSGTDALLLPFPNSWGWATWRRAWVDMDRGPENPRWLRAAPWRRWRFDMRGAYSYSAMLDQALRNEIDAWDIYWYLAMFRRGALAVYPALSLVENHGLAGGGTHQGDRRLAASAKALDVQKWPANLRVDRTCMRGIRQLLRRR